MKKEKVLLVDDEPDIIEIISYHLEKEGFSVLSAENGKRAVEIAEKELPDLILLDVMMPEMDGIETCQHLRNIPGLKNSMITFLTARNEDYSQIAGFEAGADDYITKPIKPRVLISKVKATLRRKPNSNFAEKEINIEEISVDRERYEVSKGEENFILPKKEFELLWLLIQHPGKVYSRDDILNLVWGGDVIVGERTIDVHIRKLRKKLGEEYIKTVSGVGYKFTPQQTN